MMKHKTFYDLYINALMSKLAERQAEDFINENKIKNAQITARGAKVVVWWEEETAVKEKAEPIATKKDKPKETGWDKKEIEVNCPGCKKVTIHNFIESEYDSKAFACSECEGWNYKIYKYECPKCKGAMYSDTMIERGLGCGCVCPKCYRDEDIAEIKAALS